ncbi:DUF808 domain-containing protein [Shewanella sp. KJ2020]|uniref:DUF808 domain-containing protein n=1 Tax=Shewanella sp. KJ2020 TaxID=2919172 RepID=UPI0020A73316|nr:DUF808 domain-containing protein [Shewanella sp. KJ2020]MCP3129958.1 DUF808 domain-containing protein [Shewanella sp. KJ2020]
MAGASLLTLLDDIASILDDVAVMSKVAAKKTAGVLGDDLALNAQQVTGVNADRELPVIWAVALGSFRNKLILVPAAMLISAFIPWAVTPLLMFGGLFLCYEGFEKLHHSYLHRKDQPHESHQIQQPEITDWVAFEAEKIKGAIRTDFVLSAEIIAITLGIVADKSLSTQFLTLAAIGIVMTIGVYGLVAAIVKMDDAGLYLSQRQGQSVITQLNRKLGFGLLSAAPLLMKSLTIIGTAAMFMVGGGILTHGLHIVSEQIHHAEQAVEAVSVVGPALGLLTPSILNGLFGVLAGAVAVILMTGIQKLRS